MREHHRVKVEHDRREVLHDRANQKRKIVSNDYSKHYSTTTLSKRTKNEIIDLVVDLSVVTKERVEFDRIGRIMTMLVTQATKDDKAKLPSVIWKDLGVHDAASYLQFDNDSVKVINDNMKKYQIKSELCPIHPLKSTFREYFEFFKTVHATIGGMEQTHALSTLSLCVTMNSIWSGKAPYTETQYMSLWQCGWKKYAVASNDALGMDTHLIKLMDSNGWKWFSDHKMKDQQVMSFLPKTIYLQLNDALAGICQLCKKKSQLTKYQGATVLKLFSEIRNGMYKEKYIHHWILKEFHSISQWEGYNKNALMVKNGKMVNAVMSLWEVETNDSDKE